jgi:Fatty acid cis/trans isomerase (CTI)
MHLAGTHHRAHQCRADFRRGCPLAAHGRHATRHRWDRRAYPNALFAVDPVKLPEFVDAVARLADPANLTALTDRFGVRRNDRRFLPLSDVLHAEWRRRSPGEAAVLGYSRLENN